MTQLVSKLVRDGLNINTYEKGILYSALLLRKSNTHPDNELSPNDNLGYKGVRLVTTFRTDRDNNYLGTVSVQATIPYNSQEALTSGGDFFRTILPFGNENPNPLELTSVPDFNDGLPIDSEPGYVDDLEKYFVWCSQTLLSRFLSSSAGVPPITILFYEEVLPRPVLVINADLPLIPFFYYSRGNLLDAVSGIIEVGYTTLDNSTTPDNLFLLAN
jgi:hypothetical protein